MMRRLLPMVILAWLSFSVAGADLPHELGDIIIPRSVGGADSIKFMPQAVFPHWIHRTQFKCYVCHDDIFKMKLGADKIDMDEVRDGKFCGKCHNGKTAFAIGFDTCERCHYSSTGRE